MKYIAKNCKKCGVEFNTRPCYNKEHCKKCSNNIRMKKIYRELHPNVKVIYVRGNPSESKRQWAQRNREKVKMMKYRYRYERNGVEKDKEWKKNNPEKVKIAKKKWQDTNKEHRKEYHLKDRREHPEKFKERGKNNYKKNPERYKENCRKRRIKKLEVFGFHSCKEFNILKEQTGSICLCCRIKENELKNVYKNSKYWKLTEDYIIPLTKGGSDDIENIQPLCLHCNLVKSNKIITLEELRKIL